MLYSKNSRFLDIRYGIRIWAINIIYKYSDIFVIGMDLIFI